MKELATLDYLAIGIYLAIMAGVGLFFGWFIKDIKGYFKGGSTIPWQIGAISNFMGLFSTFIFVAYAGVAYADGIVGVTVLWCTVFPCLLAAFYLGKRWVRSGIITPVEYLETRFSPSVRQVFSWAGLSMRFLDNMVRLYAIGIFLMTATSLSFTEAVLYSGLIITFFTIVGGVWAVVVMDTLQFIILVFSSLLLIPLVLQEVGGLGTLMIQYPDHFNWFNGPKGQPLWLLAYYLMILLKYNGNWVFIQRFYSVKDEPSAKKLGLLSAILFFIFPIVFLLPAIAAKSILPNLADPEMAYVAVAVKLLPAGLLGLMLAAMFSATMSSLNSEFNVMSGVLTNDIYKRIIRPAASDKDLVNVARLNVILIGVVVTLGALYVGQLGGAFEANKLLTALFAIPLAIPLILGLVYKNTTSKGALITVFLGVALSLWLNFYSGFSWEASTVLVIGFCTALFFVLGRFKEKDSAKLSVISGFFDKIRTPLSSASISPPDPKFKRALSTLFALSIGLSGLLFGGMSLVHIHSVSGKVALFISILCMVLALFIKIRFTGKLSFEPSVK